LGSVSSVAVLAVRVRPAPVLRVGRQLLAVGPSWSGSSWSPRPPRVRVKSDLP